MNQSNISHLSAYERRSSTDTLRLPGSRTEYRPRHDSAGADPLRKRFSAKGHDGQLQEAQYAKLPVTVLTMRDVSYRGTIVRRDRYTITLKASGIGTRTDCGNAEVILYKHAIESILIDRTTDTTTTAKE